MLGFIAPLATQAQQQFSAATVRILIVGDSLSAEYGLKRGSGWVQLLKQTLVQTHPNVEIINASISGDTTSGGLSRMKALLDRTKPSVVVIELGANDALRGLALSMTKKNMFEMVKLVKTAGATPILAGMQIPPNYGRDYTTAFKGLFEEVAQVEKIALIPFFLEGVADDPAMFQADTIHPNEQAQPTLMKNVHRYLIPAIK